MNTNMLRRGAPRLGALAALLLLVPGCADNDTGLNPSGESFSLQGAWEVEPSEEVRYRDGYPFGGARFVRIGASDVQVLTQSGDGFRGIDEHELDATSMEIVLDGDPYIYSIADGVMSLVYPGEETIYTMRRTKTAPSVDDWIRPVRARPGFSLDEKVSYAGDLAWDGSHLWLGHNDENPAFSVVTRGGEFVRSVPNEGRRGFSLAVHGEALWATNGGALPIYCQDTDTGDVLRRSIDLGVWTKGLASDGSRLWLAVNNDDVMIEYDPAADAVTRTVAYENLQPGGLEYVDGYLYLLENGHIHKIDAGTHDLVDIARVPHRYVNGIAFDGQSFWIRTVSRDRENRDPRIDRLDRF